MTEHFSSIGANGKNPPRDLQPPQALGSRKEATRLNTDCLSSKRQKKQAPPTEGSTKHGSRASNSWSGPREEIRKED